MSFTAQGQERQITFTPKNHCLDNNDNFSPDGRFLCYDTRETIAPGIDNCQSIEMVEIETGCEKVLYAPSKTITGEKSAPGAGAVSFSPVADKVAFIHGPLVDEVPARGFYGKPNRTGMEVAITAPGQLLPLDRRDVEISRPTLSGAHRGGTHRHEYSLDGKRIGFTYDDFLLPQYDRTIGYMEAHPKAPEGVSHYFAILVPVVPKDTAKPGEIEKAYADSWVGRDGAMRAFIGKVRNDKGGYDESLFIVDVPALVDITTADAGSADRFPVPPKGVTVRRLTHDWAGGVVRGSHAGDRIAYYGHAADGSTQIFIIPSNGSDQNVDPAKRPVQVTHLPHGVLSGLRWHPSGDYIFCVSNNAIVSVCVKAGSDFGRCDVLTPEADGAPRMDPVVSPDGKHLAYNRPVRFKNEQGQIQTTYNGSDFVQVFILDFNPAK